MCGGGEDNGGMGPGGMGGGGADRYRDDMARDAQREAGRATGIEPLDAFDRFVQNNYRGQAPSGGLGSGHSPAGGQGVSGSNGSTGGAESSFGEVDGDASVYKGADTEADNADYPVKDQQNAVRRASRSRTVLTALNVRKPKLAIREKLGVQETLG